MMATSATEQVSRRSRRPSDSGHRSLLAICGSLIALVGVLLTAVSAYSSQESGSLLLFVGCGLVLSGALLAKRHVFGAWTYMAVFAVTLAWSLQNAGLGGSSVAYRIFGPILMLVMLALLMPALRHWSRGRTVSVLSVLILATVLVGDWSDSSDEPAAGPAVSQPHYVQTKGVLQ